MTLGGTKSEKIERQDRQKWTQGTKSEPKDTKSEPKVSQKWAQSEPKGAKREPKGAEMNKNPSNIYENGFQNIKTDTSANVDFGWPKWYQNGSKMKPKGIQNLCKVESKIDVKPIPKRYRKMTPEWCKNDITTDTKSILFAKLSFCENLVLF